jgi:integration host factor subunit beta
LVKSGLVLRLLARHPHLYQRDVENIVEAILGEIADALARFDRVELSSRSSAALASREGDRLPRGGAR